MQLHFNDIKITNSRQFAIVNRQADSRTLELNDRNCQINSHNLWPALNMQTQSASRGCNYCILSLALLITPIVEPFY